MPAVTVFGSTGQIGRDVMAALGSNGKVALRGVSRRAGVPDAPASSVAADLDDGDSLRQAVRGSSLVCMITPGDSLLAERELRLAEACAEERVATIIKISSVSVYNDSSPVGRLHGLSERALRAIAEAGWFRVVVLRLSDLMPSAVSRLAPTLAGHTVFLPRLGAPLHYVDPRDVAGIIGRVCDEGGECTAYVERNLVGPEKLTWEQVARIWQRRTGCDGIAAEISIDGYGQRLLSAGVAPEVVERIVVEARGVQPDRSADRVAPRLMVRLPTSWDRYLRDGGTNHPIRLLSTNSIQSMAYRFRREEHHG